MMAKQSEEATMYSTIYRTMRPFWPGGLEMRRHLQELEQTQWFSREELEAWQLARIQRLVKHACENVPYYRDLYKRLDIHLSDIKSLKDFRALPFLTREDVNNHLDRLVSPDLRNKALPDSTGGSTGQPMHFLLRKHSTSETRLSNSADVVGTVYTRATKQLGFGALSAICTTGTGELV
jgi:phenylacetate-CoA ligase